MSKRKNKNQLVNLAFDFAATKNEGFTIHELAEHLEVTWTVAKTVIRNLREQLGDDSINVTAEPAGHKEPWTYRLVGNPKDAARWQVNRIRDAETRLGTMENVASSIKNSADLRTKEGRKARLIHKVISRLREDLAELELEDAAR